MNNNTNGSADPASRRERMEGHSAGKPLRVLVLEDNAMDAEMVIHALCRAGFDPEWKRVETEADFLAALDTSPELILSDYALPQFDGLRAAILLREHGLDIPFILISGTIGEDAAVEAMRHGAADYLLKDRITRLGPAVERALEAKRLRGEQRQAEKEKQKSDERFRELAETIEEVFWISDPDKLRILYVSPAYEKIWGRSCQSLYDQPHTWVVAIHSEDRERVRHAATTRQAEGNYDEEYRIVRADGGVRWIHDRAFPVRNAAGQVERIVGVARDITAHRQVEEQFRQAQKMEAIGQFAGGIAHDFNNMLAAIMMQTELTLMEENLPVVVNQGLQEIRVAAKKASHLTRQLLLYSCRQVMQSCELDLNEAVTSVSRMLQRLLREDVQLQLQLHPSALIIKADAGMLDQVLMNLAVNARDAMPEGGLLLIETGEKWVDEDFVRLNPDAAPGRYVWLSVSDTGGGIPPEVLPRIFDPFFTTKDPGKGTGLGLATVFGIVKQHHGWIKVVSEPGRGAKFQIFIPASGATSKARVGAATQPQPRGGTETILLAEDEPSVRAVTRRLLEHCGYRVLEAANGAEALQVWQQHPASVALLLTDIVMPGGMTGLQLARRLQVTTRTSRSFSPVATALKSPGGKLGCGAARPSCKSQSSWSNSSKPCAAVSPPDHPPHETSAPFFVMMGDFQS